MTDSRYVVEHYAEQGDLWMVWDTEGVVFRGTWRECEDWLDQNDNRQWVKPPTLSGGNEL